VRSLTHLGLGWHVLEAAVAIAAGVVAGSVALVGFGPDSVIEAAAALVVLWLVTGGRESSGHAERRAQQLIAVSFVLLATYITVESVRDLVGGHHPAASWVGVGLSAITLVAMPPLAAAKRRAATGLGSSAATSESRQTMLCAYLSAALLVGLLANAIVGWWWAVWRGHGQGGHDRGEREQRAARDREPANARREALEHREQQVAHSAAATSTAIR
jgi:divalent metal cation (Fe/Co/Zn/Cd) transporter